MTVDIGDAIENGLSRMATRAGGILLAAFFLTSLASVVGQHSLARQVLVETPALQEAFAENPEISYEEFLTTVESSLPLGLLDLPVAVLAGLALVGLVAITLIRIGAIRWFAEEGEGDLYASLFTRRVLWTIGNLIVGFVLLAMVVYVVPLVVVAIGFTIDLFLGVLMLLVALVVMLYLAVALFFYNFEIIVEGSNAIDAMVNSWNLTKGDRLVLFALGALFVIVSGVIGAVVGFVTAVNPIGLAFATQALAAVFGIAGIAVAADAYNQLRGVENADTDLTDPEEW